MKERMTLNKQLELLPNSKEESEQFLLIAICIESFPQMYFEGKWLQNRLRADKNESKSLSAVDFQGHQRGGFCISPLIAMIACDNLIIIKSVHPNSLSLWFLVPVCQYDQEDKSFPWRLGQTASFKDHHQSKSSVP